MDYAKDLHTGEIVAVRDASVGRSYACPGCGGLLYLPGGKIQRPHFRHRPGEATPTCEEYFPGAGVRESEVATPTVVSAVEDSPSELGLIVDQFDGEWRLGLRLPEIPRQELDDASPSVLRHASVEVSVHGTVISRISAIDLRPGVGAARVPVHLAPQGYRACTTGVWPPSVATDRWQRAARGVDAKGVLFRLRGGEWTRLLANSGVHYGERLLVLAEDRSAPPASIVTETHAQFSPEGDSHWALWEVLIPDKIIPTLIIWLGRIGHPLIPRPWSVELATTPRSYDERGAPVFWIGDTPVVALEAPHAASQALILFNAGSESLRASVEATESDGTFVAITSPEVGSTRVSAVAERGADIDVGFVERPPATTLLDQLTRTPRVRVWLGDLLIEAWRDSKRKVLLERTAPEVRVDLGAEDARASVTVWERGKRRFSRGLDARGAARVIAESLVTASRIELDGDNFGRIEIGPTRAATERQGRSSTSDRLGWFDHVVSLCAPAEGRTTPTLIDQPRAAPSLALRSVGAAALVRSRQSLRRRREAGVIE